MKFPLSSGVWPIEEYRLNEDTLYEPLCIMSTFGTFIMCMEFNQSKELGKTSLCISDFGCYLYLAKEVMD
jgi:hypothetical protein